MTSLGELHDNKELSPGKLLVQGRLLAGLTQDQIAKELYLTVTKVNALELDDFKRVGPDTFVRGYIRAYSNILKIDALKVLAAYENCVKEQGLQASASAVVPITVNSSKKSWRFLAFIVAFCIGLWLISIWFIDSPVEKNYLLPAADTSSLPINIDNFHAASSAQTSFSSSETDAAAALPLATQVTENVSPIALVSAVSASSVASLPRANVLNSAPATVTAEATKPIVAAANTSAPTEKVVTVQKKNSLDEINFVFRAECWLEVSDSRGDVLATELQAAGSKLSLTGRAPFDVKLGNAPAVAIQLNGKKVDVNPVAGSRVLTLKVNE